MLARRCPKVVSLRVEQKMKLSAKTQREWLVRMYVLPSLGTYFKEKKILKYFHTYQLNVNVKY